METSSSTAGESRSTPPKLERSSDRTVTVLFLSSLFALYGAFGFGVYGLFSLVF